MADPPEKQQKIVLGATSRLRDSARIIREALVKIAALTNQDLDEPYVKMMIVELCRIPPTTLQAAFDRVCKTFKPTNACLRPLPAHVLELIEATESVAIAVAADQAWDIAVQWISRYYHPDLGLDRRAPQLDERIRQAIGPAGGIEWIWGCPEGELQWARKRFIEQYENLGRLEKDKHLITGSEAHAILQRLGAPEKLLAPRPGPAALPQSTQTRESSAPLGAAFDQARDRVRLAPAFEPMTPEQEQNRRNLLELQKKQLLEKYGTPKPASSEVQK